MQSLQAFNLSISREISQKEILQNNLLLKVLSSKRLLVDHLEIIEESQNVSLRRRRPTHDVVTFFKTTGVLATSYLVFIHLKQKYIIPSVFGVMPILYIRKLANTRKRLSYEAKLSKFISALDNYESAIKKNKTFLQEAQVVKSFGEILKRFDKEHKIPSNLIDSIKNVIAVLYKLLKHLETCFILEQHAVVYEPMDNLEDCDLMQTELKPEQCVNTIKDFFNIFAYVQSQLLLRFTMVNLSNVDKSKILLDRKFNNVIEVIEKETARISKFMELIDGVSQLQTNIQRQVDEEVAMTMPKELREVRSSTINFSAKVLSVALQSQHLEEQIVKFAGNYEDQNKDEIDEIMLGIKSVENEMCLNVEELRRIAITLQKYLNMKIEDKISQEQLDGAAEGDQQKKPSRVVTSEDSEPQQDDFFFVDATDREPDERETLLIEGLIEDASVKVMSFKPVLRQLKQRIEIIGEDMKEREKKVLKAKGIEMVEEPEVAPKTLSDVDDSGSDDERERIRKRKRNQEKFSDNREFLEAKQPINFFAGGFPIPLKNQMLDEEVLE